MFSSIGMICIIVATFGSCTTGALFDLPPNYLLPPDDLSQCPSRACTSFENITYSGTEGWWCSFPSATSDGWGISGCNGWERAGSDYRYQFLVNRTSESEYNSSSQIRGIPAVSNCYLRPDLKPGEQTKNPYSAILWSKPLTTVGCNLYQVTFKVNLGNQKPFIASVGHEVRLSWTISGSELAEPYFFNIWGHRYRDYENISAKTWVEIKTEPFRVPTLRSVRLAFVATTFGFCRDESDMIQITDISTVRIPVVECGAQFSASGPSQTTIPAVVLLIVTFFVRLI